MKLLLILLLLPLFAGSQNKKDTKIVVIANDTSNLFKRVALELIDWGYVLEEKDADLKFISTGEKSLKKLTASSKIKVVIKDSVIIFSPMVRLDFSLMDEKSTFQPVEYRKPDLMHKGSAFDTVWKEAMEVANKFGSNITYSK